MIVQKQTKKKMIIDSIMDELHNGTLHPGDRLLGIRDMARKFNVSVAAVNDAYNQLEMRGIIQRHFGSGTYINAKYKFPQTRLVAILTTCEKKNIEGYYETMLETVNELEVLPLIGILYVDNWKETIQMVLDRDPDLVLIDVDGRRFPMNILEGLLHGKKHVYINRWEWDKFQPKGAVLNDYAEAYARVFHYLISLGHRKIIVNNFHAKPQPFMIQRLTTAAAKVGLTLGRDLHLFSHDTILKSPEKLYDLWKKEKPTALAALSDALIPEFMQAAEKYCPELLGIERAGVFHSHLCTIPGQEFFSVPLDFAGLWRKALEPGAENRVEFIQPLTIETNHAVK